MYIMLIYIAAMRQMLTLTEHLDNMQIIKYINKQEEKDDEKGNVRYFVSDDGAW